MAHGPSTEWGLSAASPHTAHLPPHAAPADGPSLLHAADELPRRPEVKGLRGEGPQRKPLLTVWLPHCHPWCWTYTQTPTAGCPAAQPRTTSSVCRGRGLARLEAPAPGRPRSPLHGTLAPFTPALPWHPPFPGARMLACHQRPNSYPSFRSPPPGGPPGPGAIGQL